MGQFGRPCKKCQTVKKLAFEGFSSVTTSAITSAAPWSKRGSSWTREVARFCCILGKYLSEEVVWVQIDPESLRRPSAPAMVGGRCQDDHQQGRVVELFSSEVSSLSSEVLPKKSYVTSLDQGDDVNLGISSTKLLKYCSEQQCQVHTCQVGSLRSFWTLDLSIRSWQYPRFREESSSSIGQDLNQIYIKFFFGGDLQAVWRQRQQSRLVLLKLSLCCFVLVCYLGWLLWSGKVYQLKASFPPSVWQIYSVSADFSYSRRKWKYLG